jgi:hypothetical protein
MARASLVTAGFAFVGMLVALKWLPARAAAADDAVVELEPDLTNAGPNESVDFDTLDPVA